MPRSEAVEYGIQRGTIYLAPPEGDDLEWFLAQFELREIWDMFGFPGPSRKLMEERHASKNLVVGIIRRVEGRRRIGFFVCFPPTDFLEAWEFGFAIPDPRERDGFSALQCADVAAHYMFDHLRIERGSWRVREDNRQSLAIARRCGYRPFAAWDVNGHRFQFFRIDQEKWARRQASLGDTFRVLEGPPYVPVTPSLTGGDEAE